MKAAPFEYARATDAAHAVKLLAAGGGDARPIAGGQSLGPMLNLRLARPLQLVDIRRCPELRTVTDEGDAMVYGAALCHAEFEDGAVPDPCGGVLARAARAIAYRAVRNRGTVGGSVAHADPAADWLVVLGALAAEVLVQGPRGRRAMALRDFVTGPFSARLAEGELLLGIRLRKRSPRARVGLYKTSVKAGEFASAYSAVLDDPERDERRAVVGAIERKPIEIDGGAVEALIEGRGEVAVAEGLLQERLPDLRRAALRLHASALSRAVANLDAGAVSR